MSTQGFLKPRSIEVEPVGTHHAKIVMEPFERGYGHTPVSYTHLTLPTKA